MFSAQTICFGRNGSSTIKLLPQTPARTRTWEAAGQRYSEGLEWLEDLELSGWEGGPNEGAAGPRRCVDLDTGATCGGSAGRSCVEGIGLQL